MRTACEEDRRAGRGRRSAVSEKDACDHLPMITTEAVTEQGHDAPREPSPPPVHARLRGASSGGAQPHTGPQPSRSRRQRRALYLCAIPVRGAGSRKAHRATDSPSSWSSSGRGRGVQSCSHSITGAVIPGAVWISPIPATPTPASTCGCLRGPHSPECRHPRRRLCIYDQRTAGSPRPIARVTR